MLLILIGLSSSGKNFVGEILAEEFGYYYWGADLNMPQKIRNQILKKEIFSQEMRDNFTEVIINKLAQLIKHHQKIVISQVLYKRTNCRQLAQAYPSAKFIHIKATKKI